MALPDELREHAEKGFRVLGAAAEQLEEAAIRQEQTRTYFEGRIQELERQLHEARAAIEESRRLLEGERRRRRLGAGL
jgi:hypothetical protein